MTASSVGGKVGDTFEVKGSDGHLSVASHIAWPDRVPDPIEYGREVFSALAYIAPDQSREIHVLRLRHSLERAGLLHTLRYVLAVLTLTGEIQELSRGYWLPTPVRRVPLGDTALLIAPIGTTELRRHFPEVRRAGYARVIPGESHMDLPSQALADWAGSLIVNTSVWAANTIRQGYSAMAPTISPIDIEYFGLQASGGRNRLVWESDIRRCVSVLPRVALCRSKLGPNHYRFFFGYVDKGKVTKEAPISSEIDRLLFGIAAFVGNPIAVDVLSSERDTIFRIPCVLPRPERRLMAALSTSTWSRMGKEYRVKAGEHSVLLAETLRALGCELRNN